MDLQTGITLGIALLAIPLAIGMIYGAVKLVDFLVDGAARWWQAKKGKFRLVFASESRKRELDARHDRELDEINRKYDEGEVELADVMKLARRHAKEERQSEAITFARKTHVSIALIVSSTLVLCVWIVMYMSPYQTCVRNMLLNGDDRADASLYCAKWLTSR